MGYAFYRRSILRDLLRNRAIELIEKLNQLQPGFEYDHLKSDDPKIRGEACSVHTALLMIRDELKKVNTKLDQLQDLAMVINSLERMESRLYRDERKLAGIMVETPDDIKIVDHLNNVIRSLNKNILKRKTQIRNLEAELFHPQY